MLQIKEKQTQNIFNSKLSLLFPDFEKNYQYSKLDENCIKDLDLQNLIDSFTVNKFYKNEIKNILCNMCIDPEVIKYRQDILEDILNNPEIVKCFEELIPKIESMLYYKNPGNENKIAIYNVLWRLGEFENFIECITLLSEIFENLDNRIKSSGLNNLKKNYS